MDITKLNQEQLIEGLKASYFDTYKHRVEWARDTKQTELEHYPRNGIATYAIAKQLKSKCSVVTPIFNKLVKKGLVYKDTTSTMNVWWPVGFLDEIKANKPQR